MGHELKLTNGALQCAREILNGLGWANTIELVMRGGQLLCTVLPECEPPAPKNESAEELRAAQKRYDEWQKEPAGVFQITDKQRACLIASFTHHVTQANFRPGPQSFALGRALNIDFDEEKAQKAEA